MTFPSIVEKIRSRGHWRINFRPLEARKIALSLQECRDVVRANAVSLRGWDYPHISNNQDALHVRKNSFEGIVDWHDHIEFWRMYQSSQFVHYVALDDDWTEVSHWRQNTLPIGIFSKSSVVYSIMSERSSNSSHDSHVRDSTPAALVSLFRSLE
jgi:hypothetical protein